MELIDVLDSDGNKLGIAKPKKEIYKDSDFPDSGKPCRPSVQE